MSRVNRSPFCTTIALTSPLSGSRISLSIVPSSLPSAVLTFAPSSTRIVTPPSRTAPLEEDRCRHLSQDAGPGRPSLLHERQGRPTIGVGAPTGAWLIPGWHAEFAASLKSEVPMDTFRALVVDK